MMLLHCTISDIVVPYQPRFDIIQLFDKGVVEYHFYSDEISNIRRGEAELDIILARLNKSDIRPPPRRITDLSDPALAFDYVIICTLRSENCIPYIFD